MSATAPETSKSGTSGGDGADGTAATSSSSASVTPPSDVLIPAPASSTARILNVNIGILGHVDSGKTSLAKALSTHLSTAALDKTPQSQERGITLDLGFSAFFMRPPTHLQDRYDAIQVTLVDCPGHASLIRTIIGGACIIDLMLLVIDSSKGIQTQTAECLVIGEILTEKMMVVLNKIDLLPDPLEKSLAKVEKNLRAVFANTKFGKDVPMCAVCANPASSDDLKVKDGAASSSSNGSERKPPQVQKLLDALWRHLDEPARPLASPSIPFLFSVDHCFGIKGQGTVLTGTVLQGQVSLNSMIELPDLKIERKVKSMQRFKRPVDVARQGDRVGICVTQLDSKLVERGLVCTPGSVQSYDSVIAVVDKVRFFKQSCLNKAKFHVSIGHATAMATAHFFGGPPLSYPSAAQPKSKDGSASSSSASSASSSSSSSSSTSSTAASSSSSPLVATVAPEMQFDFDREYAWRDELLPISKDVQPYTQFAVLEFEKPVQAPLQSILIGSRLDADIHQNSCRIAFQGRLVTGIKWSDPVERSKLKVYKLKERVGSIDRVADERTIIGRDLFTKGTDMSQFINMKVVLEANGQEGRIESAFGQGGKFKAYFQEGLPIPPQAAAQEGKGKGKKQGGGGGLRGKIFLRFKKYMFAGAQDKKKMVQE